MDNGITLVIPTIGRPSLARTLMSLVGQPWRPQDGILLLADGPCPTARNLWSQFKLPGQYVESPTRLGFWGHRIRNQHKHLATGLIAALDDDDIWTSGALAAIIKATTDDPTAVHLFQMEGEPCRGRVWKTQTLTHGNIGTPMCVCRSEHAGSYGLYHGGDRQFIEQTIERAGTVLWHEIVICLVRPVMTGEKRPSVLRPLPCISLGPTVERANCACWRRDKRTCLSGHGTVSAGDDCETCNDYEPDDSSLTEN